MFGQSLKVVSLTMPVEDTPEIIWLSKLEKVLPSRLKVVFRPPNTLLVGLFVVKLSKVEELSLN